MFRGSRLQGLGVQAETPLLNWCNYCPLPPWHTSVGISVVLSVPKESALALHEAARVSEVKGPEPLNYIKAISKLLLLMNGAGVGGWGGET